jgi:tRNA(fMet)-specific endonuclease VapC
MIYLPDTNALSAYLTGRDEALCARMTQEFPFLRLSALVVAERKFGILHHASGRRFRSRFDSLVELIPVEPFTLADATHYAELRSRLEKSGQGIGPLDTLIAAQALRLGATLVTHNLREFKRVPDLRLEDWQAS